MAGINRTISALARPNAFPLQRRNESGELQICGRNLGFVGSN
ncbi:BQ5605_C013g07385 [Microbotryum silenes-dioicae]|uniref:BQ5605_C013g07385 protein n=1 Tax=Microbotryum silenes-dioicae TaxID=796604 RepID=A0A2X0LRX8_9BASI|nr:BQ5605_C013g07385 [Microbotryum silenes-dioicae]